jgi:hypothetical protein
MEPDSGQNEKKPEPNFGGLLVCALVGAWFAVGGAISMSSGKWFPLFPPQLDLFSLFGPHAGGAVALMVGVALIALSFFFARRAP